METVPPLLKAPSSCDEVTYITGRPLSDMQEKKRHYAESSGDGSQTVRRGTLGSLRKLAGALVAYLRFLRGTQRHLMDTTQPAGTELFGPHSNK